MLDYTYLYKDIFLRRFSNKFYFINTKKLPLILNCKSEFHNIKNEKQFLTYYAYMEELFGIQPFFVKKGYKYNHEGKKVFTKDIRLISNNSFTIFYLLKNIYLNLDKKIYRKKLIKKIGINNFVITLLCSDLNIPLYRELFILINTFSFDIKFTLSNRFLLSYFLKNFNFI